MKDQIIIHEIQAFSRIGIYEFERELGQSLIISLDLELDLAKAARTNKLEDTIDYTAVSILVRKIAQEKEYFLLENLAHEIVIKLFESFSLIENITLEIHKPIINAEKFSGKVAIKIHRQRK